MKGTRRNLIMKKNHQFPECNVYLLGKKENGGYDFKVWQSILKLHMLDYPKRYILEETLFWWNILNLQSAVFIYKKTRRNWNGGYNFNVWRSILKLHTLDYPNLLSF